MGFDQFGKPIDRTVSGFHARVVQHETDHLHGILYPMRIRDLRNFGFNEELFPGQEISGRLIGGNTIAGTRQQEYRARLPFYCGCSSCASSASSCTTFLVSCRASPVTRNVSSARSPSVLILAVYRLMPWPSSTRAMR